MQSSVRILVDTHTLLWAATETSRLSAKASELLRDDRITVLISAASAWEIATKVRAGRLPQAKELEESFLERVEAAGYVLLPIDASVALRAGRLPGAHRDPFDRIIAAHAIAEDIPVISADAKLDGFGVRRIW
jgi:PIN domain nuclease of toxin-antitoxin system